MGNPLGGVGTHCFALFHICENVLESYDNFATQIPYHALTLVANPRLKL